MPTDRSDKDLLPSGRLSDGPPPDDRLKDGEGRESAPPLGSFGDELIDLPIRSSSAPENLTLFDTESIGEVAARAPVAQSTAPTPAGPPPSPSPISAQPPANPLAAHPATAEQTVFGRVLARGPAASSVGDFLRSSETPRTVASPAALASRKADEVILEPKMGAAQAARDHHRLDPSSSSLPRFGAPGRRIKLVYRVLAAALDASIHFAVLLLQVFLVSGGASVAPSSALNGALPGVVSFLLVFSFLYYVPSLMLWRRTPGMIWAGIESCDKSGGGLTFGQALLRWIGVLVTIGLAGLPILLSLLGRSASDILSGTVTRFSAGQGR